MRRRRWRSVFGWTNSASAVALMFPRRRRNSSSVVSSCVCRCASYAASRLTASTVASRALGALAREPKHVPVGAELAVRHDGRHLPERGRRQQRVAGLVEAGRVRRRLRARAREPDANVRRRARPDAPAAAVSVTPAGAAARARGRARGRSRPRGRAGSRAAPGRAPPRARRRAGSAASTRCGCDEVAAEPGRETFELGPRPPRREALEEVADEVPLGEPLDQPHLLDPDRDLARHRPSQLDAAGPVGDDEADQLVVGDERRGDAAAPGAGRELGAELGERDRPARVGARRAREPQAELVGARLDQVDVARLGVEQPSRRRRRRPGSSSSSVSTPRDRLGELGERLELADTTAHLAVETGVLDRARDERRGGDEEVDLVRRELARRLRVRGDDADHVAVLAHDRHAQERLEALLLELGDVLDARVGEQVVRDEGRLAALDGPPGEPFAALEARPSRRGARTGSDAARSTSRSPPSSTR